MGHKSYLFFIVMMILRYFVIAGFAFWLFYKVYQTKYAVYKIQKLFPKNTDYYREIGFSLLTMAIFAFYAYLVFQTPLKQYTTIYRDISTFGYGYFWFSILLSAVIHDTYFYWTHRLMHHSRIFKVVHLVHHRSTNPSPWAAYSFHPTEALVEGGILFVLVFTIPVHPYAIFLFLLLMFIYNVYGHLGYEFYPKWLINSKVGKWLNTSTSHNLHHQYFKDNYSLYFRFWDIILETVHPKYTEKITSIPR